MVAHLFIVIFCSGVLAGGIVFGRRWHLRLTGDRAQDGDHKMHTGVVPRVGGIAVFVSMMLGVALVTPLLYPEASTTYWVLLGSTSLIFGIGLIEDLTRAVVPVIRYSACIVAALIFSLAQEQFGISAVSVPLIDAALGVTPVSMLFFAFAVAGMSHAANLIDGENGLCTGFSLLAFVALGITAGLTGQATIAILCEIAVAANLGFLLFNFPSGRLFLGDGGAYFNGALIAILAVMVVEGSPSVSPWFAVLLLSYPITETLFTMYRRLRTGRPFYQPDSEHLHHLMQRFVSNRGMGLARYSAVLPLALAAPFVLGAPFILGATATLVAYSGIYFALYLGVYTALSVRARREITATQSAD